MDDIKKNLQTVRNQIRQTALHCGRDPNSVSLVAVSKKKSIHDIQSAFEADQKDFGENYVQEFVSKYNECKNRTLKWHFIGHLQRNKVKDIVGKVFLLHTLDTLKLAETIERICEEKKCIQNSLVQVNIRDKNDKSGCDAQSVFSFITELNRFRNIHIKGLMMMTTNTEDEDIIRHEFRELKKLKDEINSRQIYRNPLSELSMGMSHQFRLAIEEGATLIRVGRQIFGERK